ncbi:MAG: peptide ABC transporter permease [Betaproteobacteria bacterium HGW-Betaproteobacteria-18]|nr:MAG: peptide ABC transporter permease [Betaproteobacteria bacterium HGW-Betaproteobacteria-18]
MNLGKLLERVFQLIPVMLGVSAIVFLMMLVTPGDPVDIMLGEQQATTEQRDALRKDMGLDLPAAQRFVHFLKNAATGNFGYSYFHRRPVSEVILERLPATVELTVAALVIALLVAIPLGVLAAVRKNTWMDRLATLGSLLGISMPGFWFGLLLMLVFGVWMHWLPISGRSDIASQVPIVTHFLTIDALLALNFEVFASAVSHLVLPALTLGLPMAAVLTRVTRTSMLEVLRQDYVTFAHAKGLTTRRVLFVHALRNALIPTVTMAALEVGSLLGGSMIVETIFGWPGLGRVVVESIFTRNYPLIQAAILLYALTYVVINFLADLLYTVLNPRVRL